ncbi:MAG: transglutaminase domain-containing protein [Phycisphaerales bacterium]|nr:MAG: transglutaminase domain-containing protein [Phycisphaerales bacterium]
MSRHVAALVVVGAIAGTLAPHAAPAAEPPFDELPPGWKVVESFVAPRNQAAAIGKRLGGTISRLSNTILATGESRIQVNIIECPTEKDAVAIHKAILKVKGHPAFCLKIGKKVVEFVGDQTALAVKTAFELGFRPKPERATYRITFEAAPLAGGDYMAWNKLFNLFLEIERNPNDDGVRSQIAALSRRFRFGDKVALRTQRKVSKAKPAYSFKPLASGVELLDSGEIACYSFKSLPEKMGVPVLSIEATVVTHANPEMPATLGRDESLVKPTEFWPSDYPGVVSLAVRITRGCRNDREKVATLLKWLRPGVNIRFGGPVTGSRYGVKETLRQKYGQCWDFSDCFVTFCRALKIPCRQVAGWLYGGPGHIWAEVLLDGKTWMQVDPTGGGIVNCGIYHIPYITSEDGKMPILYLSMPKIELVASRTRSPG